MISITSKSTYAIYALIDLAENQNNGLTQIKNIAKRKNIPQNFLVQIFNKLVKAGIVKSVRGVNGGYKLYHSPEKISILTVLETLEGPINFHENTDRNSSVFSLFTEAENELKKVFNISLKNMLEKQKNINSQFIYYI
jgi:Rrf2 family protein